MLLKKGKHTFLLCFIFLFITPAYSDVIVSSSKKAKLAEKNEQTIKIKPLPKVAIIIDDIGSNLRKGENALTLPGDITYAVIPNTPYSKKLAQQIKIKKRELILHIPMSNIYHSKLEEGALTVELTKQQLQTQLRQAIKNFPNAVGINNHTGSELTQKKLQMDWVMEVLKKENLYFVDSRTTPLSVANSTAEKWHIPHISRDIFLDNDKNPEKIKKQFNQLITLAQKNGSAVAIGHPYDETISTLKLLIKEHQDKTVHFVFISSVVR